MGSVAGRQAYEGGALLRHLEVRRARLHLRAARGPARPADPHHDGRPGARRDRLLPRPLQGRRGEGGGRLPRRRGDAAGGHRRLHPLRAHAAVARERRRDRRQGAQPVVGRADPARRMSWRVVIVTRIPPVLAGFDAVVRAAGHEPVAFLTMRNVDGRYGPPAETGELVMTAAERARRPPARAPEHDRAAARLGRSPTSSSAWASRGRSRPTRWRCRASAGSTATRRCCRGIAARCRSRGRSARATRRSGSRSTAWTPSSTPGPILAQRRYPLGELAAAGRVLSASSAPRSARRSPRRSSGWRRATRGRRRRRAATTRRSSARRTRGSTSRVRRPRCTGSRGPGATRSRSAGRAARCSSSTARRCACSRRR